MDLSLTARRLGPLLPCTTLVAMLLFSMGKWPDPIIDFGRELYVPWAMLQGKQLYADIFYFNGPLSPYWNFLVFKSLGTGLNSIVIVNIFLLSLIVLMVFLLLRMASSYWVAIWGSTVFLLLFACSQYTGAGNYNYITPYSHEATHGTLLSLVMLFALGRSLFTRNVLWVMFAGFSLGLVFLTKPEFFLAALAGMAAFFIMTAFIQGPRKAICYLGSVVFSMLLPVLITFLLLSRQIPHDLALKGILGGWQYAGNEQLHSLDFYRGMMGTLHIAISFARLLLCTLGYCILFGIPIIVSFYKINRYYSYLIGITPLILLLSLMHFYTPYPFLGLFVLPLPIVIGVMTCLSLLKTVKHQSTKWGFRFILSLFGAALLGRIVLDVTIYNYGFALTMPAFLLSGVLFFDVIPKMLRERKRPVGTFLLSVSAFLIIFIGLYLNISNDIFRNKTIGVSDREDFFYSDGRGYFVNEAVKWIKENAGNNATLFVLPEGVMINYLTRKINPMPVPNLMPPEIAMFGEERLLRHLNHTPPDYVIFVNKDMKGYGCGHFGKGYGVSVYNWVLANYAPVKLIGEFPFNDGKFGILILKNSI